jgi:hypothetical protein
LVCVCVLIMTCVCVCVHHNFSGCNELLQLTLPTARVPTGKC